MAMVTHLIKGLPRVRFKKIIDIANVIVVVGEAKIITPLIKSDFEVLVHETESDPFFFVHSWE